MFDIGFSELLIVGIVALIVVGPKDLPGMFRTLGRFTSKARGMAREFQRAMDAAADEAGVKDIKTTMSDVKKATSAKSLGLDSLKDAADRFEKWEPGKAQPAKPALQTTDPGAVAEDAPKPAPKPDAGPHTEALAKSLEEQRAARLAAAAERRAAKLADAPAPKAADTPAAEAAPKQPKPRARKPAKPDPEASA